MKLDYKDVCLYPTKISSLYSRSEADTSVKFFDRILDIPIIAAPMKDVCNGYSAKKILDCGAFAFIHRFCSIEEQIEDFNITDKRAGCAVGLNDINRIESLYSEGCNIFCIDIANGTNINSKTLSFFKDKEINIVIGNVASYTTYSFIEQFIKTETKKECAIRVGIGGGKGCTTTNATGIYYPMFSLIQEIYNHRRQSSGIIADGNIREPGDVCKAIVAGADMVMVGSQIAACGDSSAEYLDIDNYTKNHLPSFRENGKIYKVFRGSASYENQLLYKEEPKYIEGTTRMLECKETIKEFLTRYKHGLQSCMSYFNARNLQELRQNAEYLEYKHD